jgi:hypothetical protein
MMRSKRFVFAVSVVAVAVALALLLITAFAAAQSSFGELSSNKQAPDDAQPASLLAMQEVSVTFPSGLWPSYAQEEITVHPAPPVAGQPTEVCAEVVNHDTENPHNAILVFSIANFGIGVPFYPVGEASVTVPPGGTTIGCVVWVPPQPGHWCIQAAIHQDQAEPIVSQRNIDIWERLIPGDENGMTFQVGPFLETTTIEFTVTNILEGWQAYVDPISMTLEANTPGVADLYVVPPVGVPLGSRDVVVDVEGYVDRVLVGGFRKLDWPPVVLHKPGDPFFAESEIHVSPYPPRAGEPTEICVELKNISNMTQTVAVKFSRANFGIGLLFDPISEPIEVTIPPGGTETVCTTWVPPEAGHFCIQVQMDILGNVLYRTQFSQRNLDVAETLTPGVPHVTEFQVGNVYNEFTNPDPILTDIWLEKEVYLPGWKVEFVPEVLQAMQPGEVRWVTMIVTPPLDAPLPADGTPIVDVRGMVDDTAEGHAIGGFRKVYRPPVPLHRFPDPPYAEREITVEPYPPRAGEPTEICVELRNPTPLTQTVKVQFSWAAFGIGIPFTPIDGLREVTLPPTSVVKECINWIPPVGGHVCLQVELFIPGYEPQRSQRNIDVDEPLEPLTPHTRVFPVGNPFDHAVTITLGLIPHLAGWGFELSPDVLPNVGSGEIREVTLTVIPPENLPSDGTPIVDVEAYAEGRLIGGFRKIFRPPVPIHRPKDPIYAESEIFIDPYPPRAFEPTEVGVEIRNPTEEPQTVTVIFSAADFGIGLPFMPIHEPLVVEVPPLGIARPVIMWVPPHGGLWCIQVAIQHPGNEEVFISRRNIDMGEPLEPLTPHSRTFEVRNPFPYPVTITLGLIPHFPDWGLELSQDVLKNMGVGEIREVVLTVTPPADLPADGDPIVDVEAFVDGELIGGFRKIFRPPVPVHRPKDPVYAESEIGVDPYPVIPGQPVKLSVEVFNPTDQDRFVTVTFSVANFGIGLPFSTADIAPNPIRVFVPKFGAATGHVIWTPPDFGGHFCVRVTLEMPGQEPIWSQRNIDVGEPLRPGEPHARTFLVDVWPYTEPVTVNLGLRVHRDGWDIALSQNVLPNVVPGQPVEVTLTVTPPLEVELGTGEPIVDVEAFVEGELLGGFRKLDRPPVPIHKPHEKGYAESEIMVEPYPPQVGVDSLVSTVIQNASDVTQTINLEFGWADFGMGIPFTTTGMVPYTHSVTLAPEMTQTATVTWTPTQAGHQCIQVWLSDPEGVYEPQRSQRNVDVSERPPCGQTRVFSFTVYNDSPFTATVDVGMITFNVPEEWQVTVTPSPTLEIGPFDDAVITVTVHIPCPSLSRALFETQAIYAIQQAAGSVPTIDVEGYVEGELVGGIELQFEEPAVEYSWIYLPLVLRNW